MPAGLPRGLPAAFRRPPVTTVSLVRAPMNQHFFQQDFERPRFLRLHAWVDGFLAVLAVGLVAFGLDAIFRAMH